MLLVIESKIPVEDDAIAPKPRKMAPFNPDELALIFSLIIKILDVVIGQIIPVDNPDKKNGINIITILFTLIYNRNDNITPIMPISKL